MNLRSFTGSIAKHSQPDFFSALRATGNLTELRMNDVDLNSKPIVEDIYSLKTLQTLELADKSADKRACFAFTPNFPLWRLENLTSLDACGVKVDNTLCFASKLVVLKIQGCIFQSASNLVNFPVQAMGILLRRRRFIPSTFGAVLCQNSSVW